MSDYPPYAVPPTPCPLLVQSVLHSGRPPLVVVVEVLIVTFGITCTASCGGVWERLDWPFHPPIPRRLGYIVLVFCHDKGRVGWFMVYRSRPTVIISHAIVASFGDLFTGSMGQCESTT